MADRLEAPPPGEVPPSLEHAVATTAVKVRPEQKE
jgi:hypothetical protein